jgi:hypothetical protein
MTSPVEGSAGIVPATVDLDCTVGASDLALQLFDLAEVSPLHRDILGHGRGIGRCVNGHGVALS